MYENPNSYPYDNLNLHLQLEVNLICVLLKRLTDFEFRYFASQSNVLKVYCTTVLILHCHFFYFHEASHN